jgi:virginiamycin B lyase
MRSLLLVALASSILLTVAAQSGLYSDGAQLKVLAEEPAKKPSVVTRIAFQNNATRYQLTEITCYQHSDVADAASIAQDGSAWFLSSWDDKEIRIDPETLLVTEYKLPKGCGPRSNAIDGNGAHWIISMRLDLLLESYPEKGTAFVRKPTGYGFMNHLVADRKRDTLWYTKPPENVLGRYKRGAGFKEYRIPSFDAGPGRFSLDSKGNVWFPELYGNKLGRFDAATERFTEYALPTENALPVFVLVDSRDNVWVAEHVGDKIACFKNGNFREYRVPTSNSGVNALAEAPDGSIWFAEGGWRGSASSNGIGRLDTQTGRIEEIVLPTPNSQPVALTIDQRGNVWFVEMGTGKIALIQKLVDAAATKASAEAIGKFAPRSASVLLGSSGNSR